MARRAKSGAKKASSSFNPHMTVGNFKKHRSLYTTVAKEVDVDATDEELAALDSRVTDIDNYQNDLVQKLYDASEALKRAANLMALGSG